MFLKPVRGHVATLHSRAQPVPESTLRIHLKCAAKLSWWPRWFSSRRRALSYAGRGPWSKFIRRLFQLNFTQPLKSSPDFTNWGRRRDASKKLNSNSIFLPVFEQIAGLVIMKLTKWNNKLPMPEWPPSGDRLALVRETAIWKL